MMDFVMLEGKDALSMLQWLKEAEAMGTFKELVEAHDTALKAKYIDARDKELKRNYVVDFFKRNWGEVDFKTRTYSKNGTTRAFLPDTNARLEPNIHKLFDFWLRAIVKGKSPNTWWLRRDAPTSDQIRAKLKKVYDTVITSYEGGRERRYRTLRTVEYALDKGLWWEDAKFFVESEDVELPPEKESFGKLKRKLDRRFARSTPGQKAAEKLIDAKAAVRWVKEKEEKEEEGFREAYKNVKVAMEWLKLRGIVNNAAYMKLHPDKMGRQLTDAEKGNFTKATEYRRVLGDAGEWPISF
tara:strand:- start:15709 stop:16602 length:894 start_codon:yes stop_codon:yes gene_type:complete